MGLSPGADPDRHAGSSPAQQPTGAGTPPIDCARITGDPAPCEQAASDGAYDLICDLGSPIAVGARPHYHVHDRRRVFPMTDLDRSFRWTVSPRRGLAPRQQTDTWSPDFTTAMTRPGSIRVEVALLERGMPAGPHLSLDQEVVRSDGRLGEPLPRNAAQHRDSAQPLALYSDANFARAMHEVVADFRQYIITSAAATGDRGITARFLAAAIFPEIERNTPASRSAELSRVDWLLSALEVGGWTVPVLAQLANPAAPTFMDQQLNASVGVGQIRPSTAAMVLDGPDGQPITPWVEQDLHDRGSGVHQITANYDALPVSTQRMIFAQLQTPQSNIDVAARLLARLKNRKERYLDWTRARFAGDKKAVGVVATEYNSGGTTSTEVEARPSDDYGVRVWKLMSDPLLQLMFPNQ